MGLALVPDGYQTVFATGNCHQQLHCPILKSGSGTLTVSFNRFDHGNYRMKRNLKLPANHSSLSGKGNCSCVRQHGIGASSRRTDSDLKQSAMQRKVWLCKAATTLGHVSITVKLHGLHCAHQPGTAIESTVATKTPQEQEHYEQSPYWAIIVQLAQILAGLSGLISWAHFISVQIHKN